MKPLREALGDRAIQFPLVSESLSQAREEGVAYGPIMDAEWWDTFQSAAQGSNFRGLFIESADSAYQHRRAEELPKTTRFPECKYLGIYLLPTGTIAECFFTDDGRLVTVEVDSDYIAEANLPLKAFEIFRRYIESFTPSRAQA